MSIIPIHLPTEAIRDLSDRAIFRVTGADAERYLNGQVSQDVRLATEENAVYSIVANFKGKLEGDCYIRRHDGDIWLDTCASQRESLFARLDRYLIADDAEIIDETGNYKLYHQIGVITHDFPYWECNRYGEPGRDYLTPVTENLPLTFKDTEWECLRITNMIPRWGYELTGDVLPPEAKLEERAISYTKGCYTGQEVISRMKSAGKTNRHLVQFEFDQEIEIPCELYISSDAEGKAGAEITSACEVEGKWIGLGYRTRKAEGSSVFYDSCGNSVTVI